MSILSDLTGDFISDFLDDYYAECEEHLVSARQHLIYLDGLGPKEIPDTSVINDLFRYFHSIKGLSGMVEAVNAEQIAHHIESYLRILRDEGGPVQVEAVDLIIDSVTLLEQSISDFKNGQPRADITEHLQRLIALSPSHARSSAPSHAPHTLLSPTTEITIPEPSSQRNPNPFPEDVQRMLAAQDADVQIWQLLFHPSPDLEQAGIHVTSVRQELQNLGKLIHAAPWISSSEQIAFVFALATRTPPHLPEDWQDLGLALTPYHPTAQEESATAAPVPPSQSPPSQSSPSHSSPPAPAAHGENGTGAGQGERMVMGGSLMPSNMVRVDLSRLDELMRIVGEMVISRARLEDNLDRVEQATATDDWRTFQEINQAMERQLRTLREAVMRVRMVPIGEVFVRLQFAALDVARNDRKEVRLEISGSETELDKFMVERMMDPLLHLVRNAVSHGLEQPDDRVALGKEPAGQLRLAAHTAGDTVVITIGDDGRGMALPPIERRARAMGLLSQDQQLDPNHILEMLCAPGFSTRETADLASGRGVGMTVVQQTVQELAGTLHLETVPDQGSTFTIHLPLTLAITDALIVTVAGQRFAVPLQVIHEVVQLEMAKVKRTEKRELMPYREGVLPLIRVRQVFHLDSAPAPDERDAPRDERDAPRGERGVVLVVGRNRQRVGLVVDRILSQREIVVRALADPLVRSAGLAGATELGDGQVVLILDTAALAAPSSTARRK